MLRLMAAVALGLVLAACPAKTATNELRFVAAEREPAPSLEGRSLLERMPVAVVTPGRPTVVNFWGSWCGPCREEQPLLEQAHRRFEDVTFIGVNTRNDQIAAATAFIDEFDVTYGSLYDPESHIAIAFGVRVMPATFILDADGNIAAQIIGAVRSMEQLETLLDEVRA